MFGRPLLSKELISYSNLRRLISYITNVATKSNVTITAVTAYNNSPNSAISVNAWRTKAIAVTMYKMTTQIKFLSFNLFRISRLIVKISSAIIKTIDATRKSKLLSNNDIHQIIFIP
ncbi:MAG: hypothetical protein HeimC3_40080 [Candidatus Heimdallarchaeota archaeon LC_3]|nr:MAG: hypothetical protein HeimC3_40080 [Candidatus Heimdallarchaeota archaeon LC_3]